MGGKKGKKEAKEMKNAQTWSIDLIIGVIIFMLIIAIFYAFLMTHKEPNIDDLQEDNRVVVGKFTDDKGIDALGIVKDGKINRDRFDDLCDMDYDQLKQDLGIESDFCFYLEDENENIIPCGTINMKAGIGNAKDVKLNNNYYCGQQIT